MATRSDIYTAIQNADKAGDSDSVRQLGDYLKTMPDDASPVPMPKPATDDSAMHGLALGMAKPFENIAKAGQSLLPASWKAASDAQDARLGSQTPDQLIAGNDAARANNSRTGYQTLGKAIGTAPTLALPGAGAGGMLLQGGAGGLLTSDAKDAYGAGVDGLLGAGGGVVAGGLLKGLASALTPKVAPVIQYLNGLNIPTTIGQKMGAAGGWLGNTAKAIEDKLAGTFPIAGTAINNARNGGIDALNRSAVDGVVKPLGTSLPDNIPTGHEAIAYAKKAFGNAYDGILGQMQTHIDTPLRTAVTDLRQRAAALPGDMSKTFDDIYTRLVGNRIDPTTGQIAGDGVKMVDTDLRKEAKVYARPNSTSAESQLGDLVKQLRTEFLGAASRNSAPGLGKALADTDNAYGNFVVLRNGAKNTTDGIMSPGQLQTAVRVSDQSVGKGNTATGTARMQDLSKAATSVLPSRVGDSGTAGRNALLGLMGMGTGAGALAGHSPLMAAAGAAAPLAAGGLLSLPYTKVGQGLVNGLFSAAGPKRAAVAGGLNLMGRIAPGVVPPLLARPQ